MGSTTVSPQQSVILSWSAGLSARFPYLLFWLHLLQRGTVPTLIPGLSLVRSSQGPQGMLANKQDEKKAYTVFGVALLFLNLELGMHEVELHCIVWSDIKTHPSNTKRKPTKHGKREVSKRNLAPLQISLKGERGGMCVNVLMCACVRRMCLSHTRTGRGPCFPSALPFGYTVVSQTPLYTTHPIRKATTFTLDNTCTHTHIHTRTQEENQCWEDLASLPMVQSLGKWRGSAISGLLLLTTLFSCCWCFFSLQTVAIVRALIYLQLINKKSCPLNICQIWLSRLLGH